MSPRRWILDIGAWLRGLGLQQYEPAFRANEIDVELLPKLTTEDLIALGVTLVGHRRKLLDAVAVLRAGTMSPDEKSRLPTTGESIASEPER